MENRERDKMSRDSSSSPSAGNVDRNTSSNPGEERSDSESNFGQSIGRSERWESEPNRRSGSERGMSGGGSSSSSQPGGTSRRFSEGEGWSLDEASRRLRDHRKLQSGVGTGPSGTSPENVSDTTTSGRSGGSNRS